MSLVQWLSGSLLQTGAAGVPILGDLLLILTSANTLVVLGVALAVLAAGVVAAWGATSVVYVAKSFSVGAAENEDARTEADERATNNAERAMDSAFTAIGTVPGVIMGALAGILEKANTHKMLLLLMVIFMVVQVVLALYQTQLIITFSFMYQYLVVRARPFLQMAGATTAFVYDVWAGTVNMGLLAWGNMVMNVLYLVLQASIENFARTSYGLVIALADFAGALGSWLGSGDPMHTAINLVPAFTSAFNAWNAMDQVVYTLCRDLGFMYSAIATIPAGALAMSANATANAALYTVVKMFPLALYERARPTFDPAAEAMLAAADYRRLASDTYGASFDTAMRAWQTYACVRFGGSVDDCLMEDSHFFLDSVFEIEAARQQASCEQFATDGADADSLDCTLASMQYLRPAANGVTWWVGGPFGKTLPGQSSLLDLIGASARRGWDPSVPPHERGVFAQRMVSHCATWAAQCGAGTPSACDMHTQYCGVAPGGSGRRSSRRSKDTFSLWCGGDDVREVNPFDMCPYACNGVCDPCNVDPTTGVYECKTCTAGWTACDATTFDNPFVYPTEPISGVEQVVIPMDEWAPERVCVPQAACAAPVLVSPLDDFLSDQTVHRSDSSGVLSCIPWRLERTGIVLLRGVVRALFNVDQLNTTYVEGSDVVDELLGACDCVANINQDVVPFYLVSNATALLAAYGRMAVSSTWYYYLQSLSAYSWAARVTSNYTFSDVAIFSYRFGAGFTNTLAHSLIMPWSELWDRDFYPLPWDEIDFVAGNITATAGAMLAASTGQAMGGSMRYVNHVMYTWWSINANVLRLPLLWVVSDVNFDPIFDGLHEMAGATGTIMRTIGVRCRGDTSRGALGALTHLLEFVIDQIAPQTAIEYEDGPLCHAANATDAFLFGSIEIWRTLTKSLAQTVPRLIATGVNALTGDGDPDARRRRADAGPQDADARTKKQRAARCFELQNTCTYGNREACAAHASECIRAHDRSRSDSTVGPGFLGPIERINYPYMLELADQFADGVGGVMAWLDVRILFSSVAPLGSEMCHITHDFGEDPESVPLRHCVMRAYASLWRFWGRLIYTVTVFPDSLIGGASGEEAGELLREQWMTWYTDMLRAYGHMYNCIYTSPSHWASAPWEFSQQSESNCYDLAYQDDPLNPEVYADYALRQPGCGNVITADLLDNILDPESDERVFLSVVWDFIVALFRVAVTNSQNAIDDARDAAEAFLAYLGDTIAQFIDDSLNGVISGLRTAVGYSCDGLGAIVEHLCKPMCWHLSDSAERAHCMAVCRNTYPDFMTEDMCGVDLRRGSTVQEGHAEAAAHSKAACAFLYATSVESINSTDASDANIASSVCWHAQVEFVGMVRAHARDASADEYSAAQSVYASHAYGADRQRRLFYCVNTKVAASVLIGRDPRIAADITRHVFYSTDTLVDVGKSVATGYAYMTINRMLPYGLTHEQRAHYDTVLAYMQGVGVRHPHVAASVWLNSTSIASYFIANTAHPAGGDAPAAGRRAHVPARPPAPPPATREDEIANEFITGHARGAATELSPSRRSGARRRSAHMADPARRKHLFALSAEGLHAWSKAPSLAALRRAPVVAAARRGEIMVGDDKIDLPASGPASCRPPMCLHTGDYVVHGTRADMQTHAGRRGVETADDRWQRVDALMRAHTQKPPARTKLRGARSVHPPMSPVMRDGETPYKYAVRTAVDAMTRARSASMSRALADTGRTNKGGLSGLARTVDHAGSSTARMLALEHAAAGRARRGEAVDVIRDEVFETPMRADGPTCDALDGWHQLDCNVMQAAVCGLTDSLHNYVQHIQWRVRRALGRVIEITGDAEMYALVMPPAGFTPSYREQNTDFGVLIPSFVTDTIAVLHASTREVTDTMPDMYVASAVLDAVDWALAMDTRVLIDAAVCFFLGTDTSTYPPTNLLGMAQSTLLCHGQWDVEATRYTTLGTGIVVWVAVGALFAFVLARIPGGTAIITPAALLWLVFFLYVVYGWSPACIFVPMFIYRPLIIIILTLLVGGLLFIPNLLPTNITGFLPPLPSPSAAMPWVALLGHLPLVALPPALFDDAYELIFNTILGLRLWIPEELVLARAVFEVRLSMLGRDARFVAEPITEVLSCHDAYFPTTAHNMLWVVRTFVPGLYGSIQDGILRPVASIFMDVGAFGATFPPISATIAHDGAAAWARAVFGVVFGVEGWCWMNSIGYVILDIVVAVVLASALVVLLVSAVGFVYSLLAVWARVVMSIANMRASYLHVSKLKEKNA